MVSILGRFAPNENPEYPNPPRCDILYASMQDTITRGVRCENLNARESSRNFPELLERLTTFTFSEKVAE